MSRTLITKKELAVRKVNAFLQECIDHLSFGFHVDHDFLDYVDMKDKPTYTKKDAKKLNNRMEYAWALCDKFDLDIYELALDIMNKIKM